MLAATLGVLAPGAVLPAAAGPPGPGLPAAVPVLRAPADQPDDDAADPDRPVRIEVGRFEPRTVTPGSVVTVTGTLTNAGEAPVSDLVVRLQRGQPLTSRAELAANDTDPDPATAVRPPFQELPGDIPPGGELEFTYSLAAEELQMERDAVYPVLLNINGVVDGGKPRRVGELSTFVVHQSVTPAARTTVAWLWPLVERTHRSPSGGFRDDELADSVDQGGRLDRALAVVERLPVTVPAGETEPVPALRVTLAIDPALVEELTIMAAGPYPVDGADGAGRGTEEAADWLDRLRAVAEDHPVLALSYGDVDADALTGAGLSDALVRTLPGTPQGTAEDYPGLRAPDGSSPSSPAVAPAPSPGGDPDLGAGALILADALGVVPVTDVAWAVGGAVHPDTLATMQGAGVDQVVLDPAGLTDGGTAVGLRGGTAAARAPIATAGGPLQALVADPVLSQVVGSAETVAGGPRMAEQRYLAELAALELQAPAGFPQTVLVAPSRTVEAGPDGAGAMMAGTAALPWLQPGTLATLAEGPSSAAGELVDPVGAPGLDPTGMVDVVAAAALRDDLAGAVVGDADAALAAYDAALARTTSASWRADPEAFSEAAMALRTTIDRLRGRVTLLDPAAGTYSLASSDAPLVLTVHNGLPFAVEVLLEVRVRGNRGLSIGELGATALVPGERTTLQVPTEVRQSGGFAVTAQLTTPGGGLLGAPVQMQVKSTTYGSISLLITSGAAALLALLFLRRLVRYLRRRRAAAGSPGGGTPDVAGLQPPTRSPV